MAKKRRDMGKLLAGAAESSEDQLGQADDSAVPSLSEDQNSGGIDAIVARPGTKEGGSAYDIPAATLSNSGRPASKRDDSLTKKRRFILEIDPSKCRRWTYYDRFPEWFTYEGCKDVIDSMEKRKRQEFPGVVRKLVDDPDGYEWEVVFAGRRHFAAAYLTEKHGRVFPFVAEERNISDKEAAELMDLENTKRKGLSNFESCVSYRQQLGKVPGFEPIYETINELKEAILATVEFDHDEKPPSKASFSQMVAAGELNEVEELIPLFQGRRIKIKWSLAYHLMQAWNKGGDIRKRIAEKADSLRDMADEKPVDWLLKALIAAAEEPEKKEEVATYSYSRTFKDDGGAPIVKAKLAKNELNLKIPIDSLKDNAEAVISELIGQAMKDAKGALDK